MNKFMMDKIDTIEKEAGYRGLLDELNREVLYVERLRDDPTYSNDKSVQETITHRTEYITEIKRRMSLKK